MLLLVSGLPGTHEQKMTSDNENNRLSLDLLQNYSINALLNQNGTWNGQGGDTRSISDLLGLNSPRGQLSFGSTDPLNVCTPPASPQNMQGNFDDARLFSETVSGYGGTNKSMKSYQRNISLGSAGSSPASPPYLSRNFRSISYSESCGSNSPALFDHPILGRNYSRSDSGDVGLASGRSNLETSASDLLASLTLNETAPKTNIDGDISNLQNLPAIHALKYLQQQPPFINPLLPQAANNIDLADKWTGSSSYLNSLPENCQLDRAARFHRSAALLYDAVCTWSGVLPPRTDKATGYSSKVFLGGVPWDISEDWLVQTFKQFGPVKVDWPGKDRQASQPKGHAYIILESEKAVKALLQTCSANFSNRGTFYFKLGYRRIKSKDVQVIPWYLSDSNYTKSASQKLDPSKTVFVGALHNVLTAQGLAVIMNDLFDGVVYAGIDTDKYKYPIGSGRVTFNNSRSYMEAVSAAFIEIKTPKFTKKVQVDPYLEDSLCSLCSVQQGTYFCRDITCFRYYCRSCWSYQHGPELRHHNPMSRNSKNTQLVVFGHNPSKHQTSRQWEG
uniref:RRM domain-containing protein n=2 Tax=Dendroctonus ponderosae TaxID=77166 RepID=A0AAR5Q4U1_DENPD